MTAKLLCCLIVYTFINNFYCSGENYNKLHSRLKRSELFGAEIPDDVWQTTDQSDEKNWFQRVLEFLFGDSDVSRGIPGGLFTRIINWVKNGWCHLNDQCEDEDSNPTPDFPNPNATPDFSNPNHPTSVPSTEEPTKNPDAEEMTTEKKESNDVQ